MTQTTIERKPWELWSEVSPDLEHGYNVQDRLWGIELEARAIMDDTENIIKRLRNLRHSTNNTPLSANDQLDMRMIEQFLGLASSRLDRFIDGVDRRIVRQ